MSQQRYQIKCVPSNIYNRNYFNLNIDFQEDIRVMVFSHFRLFILILIIFRFFYWSLPIIAERHISGR